MCCMSAKLTFPYYFNMPAERNQLLYRSLVANRVVFELLLPEVNTSPGHSKELAIVLVPETSMHQYYGSVFGQYNVWASGEAGTT